MRSLMMELLMSIGQFFLFIIVALVPVVVGILKKQKAVIQQKKSPISSLGRGESSAPLGMTQTISLRSERTIPTEQPTTSTETPLSTTIPLPLSRRNIVEREDPSPQSIKKAVIQGFVWAQILGLPRAYRPYSRNIRK